LQHFDDIINNDSKDKISDEMSLEDLRKEAKDLENEVLESIKRAKREAHEIMLEANRAALIRQNTKKPLDFTFKPFANLKEMLV
tara:strand:- start:368 stop:619 length:252 start_codon:yes stop_codon:yes gene_type:complete